MSRIRGRLRTTLIGLLFVVLVPACSKSDTAATATSSTAPSTPTTAPTTTTTVSLEEATRRVPTNAEAGGFVADLARPVAEASSTLAAREARLGWAHIGKEIFSIGLVPGTFQNASELGPIQRELVRLVALPAAAVFRAKPSITQVDVVVLGCDFELSKKTVYIVNRDDLGNLDGTAASSAAAITAAAKVPVGHETWAAAATALGAGDRFESQKECASLSRLDGRAP